MTGFDINEEAMKKFVNRGGRAANTPEGSAAAADILVIVVATSHQVTSALFGEKEGGALGRLPEAACILLCITADPAYIIGLGTRLKAINRSDVRLIDCPISGGEIRAQQGTLSLLCAGKEEDVRYVHHVLDCIGSRIHKIPGGVGAGSSVKMVHQILVGCIYSPLWK